MGGALFNESDRTIDQYKRMRIHPMVNLGLSFIKIGLPDVPFIVTCDDPDKKAVVEAVYKKIWKRMIKDALECLDFGFKTMENLYEVNTIKYKDENGNEKIFTGHVLKQPKSLDPDTVSIIVNDKGNFTGFDQDATVHVTVKDKKALLFVNRLESGNFYGISDLEYIYTPWYDWNIVRQFSMRWLERKGTGLFKGRYPVGQSIVGGVEQENSQLMLNLMDNVMEGTAVSLPSGADENGNVQWDIEILDSEDKTDAFIAKQQYLDDAMLRGLVIPEKSLTQGEVGARSSIESFQAMFIQRKQDSLDSIVYGVNEYSLKPFLEINYGIADGCTIQAGKIDDNSVIVANTIIQKMIEKGSIKPDLKWLEEKTKIPIEEEEIIEEPVEEEPVEEEPVEEEPVEEDNIEKDSAKDSAPKDEKKQKLSLGRADINFEEKKFTRREEKFSLRSMGSFLNVRNARFEKELIDNIMNVQLERVKRFITKNFDPVNFMRMVKGIKIAQGPVNTILKDHIRDVNSFAKGKLESGLGTKKELSEVTEITDWIEEFAEPTSYIGFRTAITNGKFLTDLLTHIQFSVNNSLAGGASLNETLFTLTEGTKEFVESRAGNIASTESGFSIAQANKALIKENKEALKKKLIGPEDEIVRWESSAILDDRTTQLCTELNGLVVLVGSPIKDRYETPRHFHCRSVWLPITRGEVEDPDFDDTDLTVGKNGKPITSDQVTAQLESIPVNKKGTKSALDEKTFTGV